MNYEKFKEIIRSLGFIPGEKAVPFKGLPVRYRRTHFVQHENVHLGEADRRNLRDLIGRLEALHGDALLKVEVHAAIYDKEGRRREYVTVPPEEAMERGDLYGAWVRAEIDLGHVAMAPWFDGNEDASAPRVYELGRHLFERAGYDVAESVVANGCVYPADGFADYHLDLDESREFAENETPTIVDASRVPIEWDRWQWMVEDLKGALDDFLDPLEELCVGIDDGMFYVRRRAEELETVLCHYDEGEWWDDEAVFVLVDRLAGPVVERVEKAIEGFVKNEEVHNGAEEWIEEHPILARLFEKAGEALEASDLEERVDWKASDMGADPVVLVRDAAERLLCDRLDVKGRLFGRYRHLRMLRRLAVRDGRRVVRSPILPGSSTKRYALRQQGEEYHFDLAELFEETPARFYAKAVEALARRLRSGVPDLRVYEVASRVFVGLEDSLAAGNCRPGTMGWVATHGIRPDSVGGVRGDVLLAADPSPLVKKAVEAAAKRLGLLS